MTSKAKANTIYRAYKQGEITLPKGFAKVMYHTVGMSWYEAQHDYEFGRGVAAKVQHITSVAAEFIWEGRIDLAQAVIDGKNVEEVTVTKVIREFEVTQDVYDHPENYGIDPIAILFYNVGETYTEEENTLEYIIK